MDKSHYSKLSIICKNINDNPHCPHGPTLLFKRSQSNGHVQQYYACSAYQNRKDCRFVFANKVLEDKIKNLVVEEKKRFMTKIDVTELYRRAEKLKKINPNDISFCLTCSHLILPEGKDLMNKHKDHNLRQEITYFLLTHPSKLLYLQSNSRKEAQFMFSDKTVDVIMNGLKQLGVRNLICLGTPTLHERAQENRDGFKSIFLDIDHRYLQFYSEEQFCWFNMMNFYPMRGKDSFKRVQDFLHSDDVVVLMDPPFSARSEPLDYTLSKLNEVYQQQIRTNQLPVVWIFPYFKEEDICSSRPDMLMLDYEVKYINQKQFKEGGKSSVVRIFTNLDASKFSFPETEGYHFCNKCRRWVSRYNKHCFKCSICPSKNGQPYVHCDICSRCVKKSWKHCLKCNRCALEIHPCDIWQGNADSDGKISSTKRKMSDTPRTRQAKKVKFCEKKEITKRGKKKTKS